MGTTYAQGRTVYDADSHVMELPGWLDEYADAATRKAIRPLRLGFHAQFVFPTFASTQFTSDDLDVLYGGADALNRAMAAFCADDPRLLAVATVPWGDPARSVECAGRAVDAGCRAAMVASDIPNGVVSPTHPDHNGLWELLETGNVPVVTHIGGGGRSVRPNFHDNDRPVSDLLGGGENIRSKDFMGIHHRPEIFWASMVLDGIFDRFPGLRGASVEEGAMWVVPWIRRLDRAMQFSRTEPPLGELSKPPSAFVQEHLRFTPFPGEPVGWMMEQAGDDLFLFSSDYPHPEGTRDPIARFEATMGDLDESAEDKFFAANFRTLYRGSVPV